VVRLGPEACDEPWRELAARLGAHDVANPRAAARAIADGLRGAVAVVEEAAPTAWGGEVLRALAAAHGASEDDSVGHTAAGVGALHIVLTARDIDRPDATVFVLDATTSDDDARRWWDAVVRDPGAGPAPREVDGLAALEAWWLAARATPASARAPQPLADDGASHEGPGPRVDSAAATLLVRLALAQRSWPIAHLAALGPADACDELVARGAFVAAGRGRVACATTVAETAATAEDARAVAAALEAAEPRDAWACA
jgi:hypothetical protein